MKDLTREFISNYIVVMAVPIFGGMLMQTLSYVIDLYFVSRLGDAAIAAVTGAGMPFYLVFALTQTLGVGIVVVISQAAGRNDQADINRVFNQAIPLAGLCAMLILGAGYGGAAAYMRMICADGPTAAAGSTYLFWSLPGLALEFGMVAMESALRGTGVVNPTTVVRGIMIALNAVLAPILIAGGGTGHPLGVAGAGLATSVSVGTGVVLLAAYFMKAEKYMSLEPRKWKPIIAIWRRILKVGLPAGTEFALIFVHMTFLFWAIRHFGEKTQAGFGVGTRVVQSLLMPGLAIAFSVAPIVGQNFSANRRARVRSAFRSGVAISTLVMLVPTVLCRLCPEWFTRLFTSEPATIEASVTYLRIVAWDFVGCGIVFVCSSAFQGMGNTWPSLISSVVRMAAFILPVLWFEQQPWFESRHFWYVSVASQYIQSVASLMLVRHEFRVHGISNTGGSSSLHQESRTSQPIPEEGSL